ncbi:hypothetical protein PpBr36_08863, partial [Pyricularia pennisetigena]|uniref:hypothetical protein n=1 Tax=Pyricularia pennisetigena TaxID=1578925 RepID=UPI00114FCEDA
REQHMSGQDSEEALSVFQVPLAPTGRGNEFRTQNISPEDWERRNVVERTQDAFHVYCDLMDVKHGTFGAAADMEFATLLVFRFRFDPQKKSRRIREATVKIEFVPCAVGQDPPEVISIAPDERWSLVTTMDHEEIVKGGKLGLDGSAASVLTATGSLEMQKTTTRHVSDATTVTGTTNLGAGRNSGLETVARWRLLENARQKTGVPDSVRVAVLVRRETDDPFNAIVTIEAEADLATNFGSLFRKVPLDDPVLFNPRAERKGWKTNEGRSRGVENLGAEPLYSYCEARVSEDEGDFMADELLGDGAETPELDDRVRAMFIQHLEDASRLDKSTDKGETTEERDSKRKTFVKDFSHLWHSRMRPGGGNFLHFLASQEYGIKLRLEWLMALAINRLPHLMGVLDDRKLSPLSLAISVGNIKFSWAVCVRMNSAKKEIIGEALKSECEERDMDAGVTCLHRAISSGLMPRLIQELIKFVPHSMFSAADSRGRTPLHLAVEYSKGSPDQVAIVQLMLERGPAALKCRTTHALGMCSAYQYHERTRREYRASVDNEQIKPPSRPYINGQLPDAPRRDEKPENDAKKIDRSKQDKTAKEGKPEVQKWPQSRQGNDSISGSLTAHEALDERPSKHNARNDANNNKDKELWYDFGPKPETKISEKAFRKQFLHLDFDSVLQYVAFPRIELEKHTDAAVNENDKLHSGRQDMIPLFKWLREKGVKRIIRVEVDDMEMPCHSDEAIEEALAGFDVEVLDWKLEDLDVTTLHHIGDKLREVHLYWGGRNAVLRSWSEKGEGLCKLPALEKITVKQVRGLECESRTKANLESFQVRLNESWGTGGTEDGQSTATGTTYSTKNKTKPRQTPKVGLPESSPTRTRHPDYLGRTLDTPPPQERRVDPHKWMLCMEEFASSFRQIRELRKKHNDPFLRPVTIALIDDGVNITHEELCGRNFPGKSFDHYKEDGWWRVSPYWNSATGHGTLMARLIQRICPSATIHVIKLKTVRTVNSGKIQIDSQSAVQAIRHATEIGAQVICMSWTTKPPEDAVEKTAFDDAIRFAHSKDVLMFCAASDQGSFPEFTYPHASNPNYTFRIGAARATGKTADFVGGGQDLSFVFPGHDVVMKPLYSDVGTDNGFDAFASHTGSSVATALATGLAALVYECVRLAVIYAIETKQTIAAVRRDDLTMIRSKQRMEDSLQSIGFNLQTGNKYLLVWNRFEKPARQLRDSEGVNERQMEIVANLARSFLTGIQDS